MKFKLTLICLIFAVTLSLASKTSPQTHLTASSKSSKLGSILNKTSLGNGLISLVNLWAKNKQNGTEEEWKDLFEALDLLKKSLQNKLDEENIDYENDKVEHNNETLRISGLIQEYEGNQATLEFTRDDLDAKFASFDLEKKNLEGQLSASIRLKEEVEQYLEKIQKEFDKNYNDQQEAVNLLNQAIDKLKEAEESAQSAGFQTFVQMNKLNFESFAVLVQESVQKLPSYKTIFLQPISTLFTDLQNESKDIDPVRISKAIAVLQELKTQLMTGLVSLKQAYMSDKKASQEQLDQVLSEISLVSTVMLPAVQSQIDTNREDYDINDKALQEVMMNIRIENGFLDQENESWSKRQEIHNLLVPQLNKEYEIVVAAEKILSSKKP